MNLNNIFKNNLVNIGTKFDYIYSLEIKGVLKGFKKIAKLEPFTIDNLESIKEALDLLGIKYIYFFKNEYFNEKKMMFIKGSYNKDKFIDVYISKSVKTLEILENLLENNKNNYKNNYLIGKLLGYPDCCIKAFLNGNYTGDVDVNLKVKNKTIGNFDWRLNNLINPYSLIPFFPCSYNCGVAIKYAENNIEMLGNKDEIKKIFKNIIKYKDFWDFKILEKNDIEGEDIFDFSKGG